MQTSSRELALCFSPSELERTYLQYQSAKRNAYNSRVVHVPEGCDGVTNADFGTNICRNTEEISKAVFGGKYFFYPYREVRISKSPAGERSLQVSRIRDTVVLKQLYNAIHDRVERLFTEYGVDKVSFAYRRRISPHHVAVKLRAWISEGYSWALDGDIEKFFDNLDHTRLMDCVDEVVGQNSIERQLIWRFIRTPSVPYDAYRHLNPQQRRQLFQTSKPLTPVSRLKGIPQGGAVSGILANLYMCEFDVWVLAVLSRQFDIRYLRYADDFVVLTRSEADAQAVWQAIHVKLASIGLTLHSLETKSKIVDVANTGLDFVGFHVTKDCIGIRKLTVAKFKQRMSELLQTAFRSGNQSNDENVASIIRYRVNPKIVGPPHDCPTCGLPIKRRSWIGFFAPSLTDVAQLKRLDKWVRQQLMKRLHTLGVRVDDRNHLERLGLSSLVSEYRRIRNNELGRCIRSNVDAQADYENCTYRADGLDFTALGLNVAGDGE